MKPFTIAIYLRISDEDKDKEYAKKAESDSITNQRNLLLSFIRQMPEWKKDTTLLEFCDDGWSGKNFERPAVLEMLRQTKLGEIQCIVVKDISRFGRDYLMVGNYLFRIFPFLNVRFISVNDRYDSIRSEEINKLELPFQTLLYDFYSQELSKKVRNAKCFQAQRGEFLSAFAPFGYKKDEKDKKRLRIDQKAADIVRYIFQMAADGKSTTQIARKLNQEQILTPMLYKQTMGCSRSDWPCVYKENFWTRQAVIRILRDERYTGKVIYGKRIRKEVGDSHTCKVSQADWIKIECVQEAIVTQEEFTYVQTQLKAFKECRKRLNEKSPFYKKVRCAVCGHIMVRVKGKQPYYICHTPQIAELFSCSKARIAEEDLINTILEILHVQLLVTVEYHHILEIKENQNRKWAENSLKKLSELKKDSRKINQNLQNLYEEFILEKWSKPEYLEKKANWKEKQKALLAQIQIMENRLKQFQSDKEEKKQSVEEQKNVFFTEELNKTVIPFVLQEILIYPDKRFCFVWNYQEKRLLFGDLCIHY